MHWDQFEREAPHVAEVFARRHKTAHNLCLIATTRADGYPRISPMEPRIFDDKLVLVGMPNTRKFMDLERDPRFCLHTATIDPYVGEGDAKLWGKAVNVQDKELHEGFAEQLVAEGGPDIRGQVFDPFYVADITSASCIEFADGRLQVTIWKPGAGERVEQIS